MNGVKYSSDSNKGAEAGYEEWRAVVGPRDVPDNGSTLVLLGMALALVGFGGRRLKIATQA